MSAEQRYELDTIATCIMTAKRQPRFRFSALMTEPVDHTVLQQALDATLPRFPYFLVSLKEGFFWPYFVSRNVLVPLEDDGGRPFADPSDPESFFRITYHGRTVSLEMHHVLADGYGATVFLQTLLAQYVRLLGVPVPTATCVLDLGATPDPAEHSDPIAECCRGTTRREPMEPQTYRVPGTPTGRTVTTTGIMRADAVRAKARGRGVSVTEYLSALLVHALAEQQRTDAPARALPAKVSVSANLRRFYPSITLRNFAYFANIGITPAGTELALADTMREVRRQSRDLFSEQRLNERMSAQMRYYKLLKPLPLAMKRAVFELVYLLTGERTFSMVFTNMGVLELPEGLREHVVRMDTLANDSGSIKLKCGAITCNGLLSVTFTNGLDSSVIEDRFFGRLAEEGIEARIETDAPVRALQRPIALDEERSAKETA